ncbi:MAG: redox-sensing transcriptional repressor Rex [Oscillospiraceae bacterium]
MPNYKVSLPVIKRLPRYYRYVMTLKSNGVQTVSSSELAVLMGTTASQVRQDFNSFGGFGQQGIGYNVDTLVAELEKLLFSGTELSTILVGTGKLGRAVSQFLAVEARGHKLMAAFDQDASQVGTALSGLAVQDISALKDWCAKNQPQIAVLCIPAKGARELVPILKEAGVKGFWNFSHYDLAADEPDVVVENVHLADSLMSLGYRVRNANI